MDKPVAIDIHGDAELTETDDGGNVWSGRSRGLTYREDAAILALGPLVEKAQDAAALQQRGFTVR